MNECRMKSRVETVVVPRLEDKRPNVWWFVGEVVVWTGYSLLHTIIIYLIVHCCRSQLNWLFLHTICDSKEKRERGLKEIQKKKCKIIIANL